MAGTLDQSQTSGGSFLKMYNNYIHYMGQGIEVGMAGQVVQVDLFIRKVGSPSGNGTVSIWSKGEDGAPDTLQSDETSFTAADFSTAVQWKSFEITGSPTYSVGDDFCIVINYSGGGDTNRIEVVIQFSDVYSGGLLAYGKTGIWTTTGWDMNFRTYMEGSGGAGRNLTLLGVGK